MIVCIKGRKYTVNSCELVTLISSLSCAISEAFTEEELVVIATVFTQLGDSLATILANNEFNRNI